MVGTTPVCNPAMGYSHKGGCRRMCMKLRRSITCSSRCQEGLSTTIIICFTLCQMQVTLCQMQVVGNKCNQLEAKERGINANIVKLPSLKPELPLLQKFSRGYYLLSEAQNGYVFCMLLGYVSREWHLSSSARSFQCR
jgi:hypothetical protein